MILQSIGNKPPEEIVSGFPSKISKYNIPPWALDYDQIFHEIDVNKPELLIKYIYGSLGRLFTHIYTTNKILGNFLTQIIIEQEKTFADRDIAKLIILREQDPEINLDAISESIGSEQFSDEEGEQDPFDQEDMYDNAVENDAYEGD